MNEIFHWFTNSSRSKNIQSPLEFCSYNSQSTPNLLNAITKIPQLIATHLINHKTLKISKSQVKLRRRSFLNDLPDHPNLTDVPIVAKKSGKHLDVPPVISAHRFAPGHQWLYRSSCVLFVERVLLEPVARTQRMVHRRICILYSRWLLRSTDSKTANTRLGATKPQTKANTMAAGVSRAYAVRIEGSWDREEQSDGEAGGGVWRRKRGVLQSGKQTLSNWMCGIIRAGKFPTSSFETLMSRPWTGEHVTSDYGNRFAGSSTRSRQKLISVHRLVARNLHEICIRVNRLL